MEWALNIICKLVCLYEYSCVWVNEWTSLRSCIYVCAQPISVIIAHTIRFAGERTEHMAYFSLCLSWQSTRRRRKIRETGSCGNSYVIIDINIIVMLLLGAQYNDAIISILRQDINCGRKGHQRAKLWRTSHPISWCIAPIIQNRTHTCSNFYRVCYYITAIPAADAIISSLRICTWESIRKHISYTSFAWLWRLAVPCSGSSEQLAHTNQPPVCWRWTPLNLTNAAVWEARAKVDELLAREKLHTQSTTTAVVI